MSKTIEKWFPWPIPGITNKNFFVESLNDTYDGLELVLSENIHSQNKVELEFGLVESYRFCDEHTRMDVYKKLEKSGIFEKHTSFKIQNSEYINWLSKASDTLTDIFDLKHYVILDDNGVFDIVAYKEPVIKWR